MSIILIKDGYTTFIQGSPFYHEKPKFWNYFRKIGENLKELWMAIANYHVVLDKIEKWDGKEFRISKAKACFDFIDKSKMIDIGYSVPSFTWSKKTRKKETRVGTC